jgi:predicted membrane channel-forming protein YqfA (hemolysin III family)
MSLALLIAVGAGWLQRVSAPVMFCALIPVYVAPGLVLALCAVSWFILLIPSLALAGYLLRLSVEIYTSRRPRRFVLTLLIASVCCSVLYLVAAAIVKGGEKLGHWGGGKVDQRIGD